jgi:hypothetical protein
MQICVIIKFPHHKRTCTEIEIFRSNVHFGTNVKLYTRITQKPMPSVPAQKMSSNNIVKKKTAHRQLDIR